MPESSLVLQLLWQSALVPLAAALGLLAAGRALRLNGAAAALAVAAAFLATFFATLHAQWSAVPKVALDWMPWIALAAAAGALFAEGAPGAARRLALRLAIGLAVGVVVVWGAIESLGATRATVVIVVTGLLIAAVWSAMGPVGEGGARRPMLLAMVAGGMGLALMLDSSQSIGQLGGGLAVALGACMLFNLPRPRLAFPPAAAGTAVVLLGALMANAYVYAGFSLGYVALLLLALLAEPVLVLAARLRRREVDPRSWLPATVLTAVPVAVTVGLVLKAAHDSGGY
jgi:hypothetical protein